MNLDILKRAVKLNSKILECQQEIDELTYILSKKESVSINIEYTINSSGYFRKLPLIDKEIHDKLTTDFIEKLKKEKERELKLFNFQFSKL
jgi:hypothetical protein